MDEKRDFAPVGVYDLQDLQKSVTEQCNQMEPPVRAVFTAAEVEGHQICSAEIPGVDFAERPCYYKGKGRTKGPYVRVGDADLPMTDYELYSFEAFRRHLHDDERPIERAAMNTLDENQIQSYLLQKMERLGFAHLSEEQVLERCRILALLGVIVCHTNILKQKARLDYPHRVPNLHFSRSVLQRSLALYSAFLRDR